MTGGQGKLTLVAMAAIVSAGVAMVLFWPVSGRETVRIDAMLPTGPGPLDGQAFTGMVGPDGKPKDVADTFVFENGTFVSKECNLRCKYPARPYQSTATDTGISFTSTTRCPYKDATIVWRGQVSDGRISGTATWTINRWYWSLTREFAFEGVLQDRPADTGGAG